MRTVFSPLLKLTFAVSEAELRENIRESRIGDYQVNRDSWVVCTHQPLYHSKRDYVNNAYARHGLDSMGRPL